jgi:glyoxylase I family protein
MFLYIAAASKEGCVAMNIHGVAPLLQVFDMPTAIRFYRDVLGFTVWATSEPGDDCNWAGLRLNGAEVMLNTAYELTCDRGTQSAAV